MGRERGGGGGGRDSGPPAAYFRCIKASSALEKWETTLEMCGEALKVAVCRPPFWVPFVWQSQHHTMFPYFSIFPQENSIKCLWCMVIVMFFLLRHSLQQSSS